ncbi:PREDICTED: uncharacterized protein LOC107069469 isoform X2 [Polistes dominula]|uniref:Uncharacterized protein LOC107069469 isoform X1 n=1 Tax=Polistes dominula TaxID=743375 RepID=A0ABM1IQ05_POLDO|nr:PREDICTED: uncharacterized protein LOC107069469 isoform X1 [Polistes dominula]XP_015182292.1 PREDICTED: uncharacterized protein LOC107069469 isoform X2 [Polistes dominula]
MAQPTSEADVNRADIYTKKINACEFRNVTLPAFWKEEPNLWFVILEKEFAAYNIKSDDVKVSAVVRNLDTTLVKEVYDILTSPPEQCTYTHLKEALIHRLTKSDEQRLRRLLMGDKILERERQPKTAAISEEAPIRSVAQTITNREVAELRREIAQLTEKIEKLMRGRRKYRSFRRRSRSRSRSSSTHRNKDGLCYYHWKFAERSWKCRSPCKWTGPDKRKHSKN